MTDDLERRLRRAFEAKASQITPPMIDVEREREVADELASMTSGHRRRWVTGGLVAAAAVAAAVGVGVVISDQPPVHQPAVAANSPRQTSASPPLSSTSTPTGGPTGSHEQSMPVQLGQPSAVTTPPATPTSGSSHAPAGQASVPGHLPSTTPGSEPTPSEADGNYYLYGELRTAAGVAYLPLPASIPTYIESQTGRTTVLRTDDLAGIAAYWKKVMPAEGWTQDSAVKWTAPTGNAWAFLSKASGAGTIQISAGP